ncbi:hypothetical protein HY621_00720 [Candidatus Uhrbacteria bacterium]|nr:hypothetical protein [Candidatus Uhrbacteria bacterium]
MPEQESHEEAALLDELRRLEAEAAASERSDAQFGTVQARLTPFSEPPPPAFDASQPFDWDNFANSMGPQPGAVAGEETFGAPGPAVPLPSTDDEAEKERQRVVLRTQIQQTADKIAEYRQESVEIANSLFEKDLISNADDSEFMMAYRIIDDADFYKELSLPNRLTEQDINGLQDSSIYFAELEKRSKDALEIIRAKYKELLPSKSDAPPKAIAGAAASNAQGTAEPFAFGALDTVGTPSAGSAADDETEIEKQRITLRTQIQQTADKIAAYRQESIEITDSLLKKGLLTYDDDSEIKKAFDRIANIDHAITQSLRNIHTENNIESLQNIFNYLAEQEKASKDALEIIRTKHKEQLPSESDGEKKDAAELRTLKAAYEKAKNDYNQFFGAVRLFEKYISKKETLKEKLMAIKENYERAFAEYKTTHIEQSIQTKLTEIDSEISSDAKNKNLFIKIHEGYKKTGLLRLGVSSALLGIGTFFGVSAATDARRWMGSTAAGVGFYDIYQWGVDLLRTHFGKLKNLSSEEIKDMGDLKKVASYIVALEIDAANKGLYSVETTTADAETIDEDAQLLARAKRGIALQDDIRYVELRKRFDELKADQLEHKIDEEITEEEERIEGIIKSSRTKEKIFRGVIAGTGFALSGTLTTLLGLGTIATALGIGKEIFEKGKEAGKVGNLIGEISKKSRELIQHTIDNAVSLAEQKGLNAGLSQDQIKELTDEIREQAHTRINSLRKETWGNAIKGIQDVTSMNGANITEEEAGTVARIIEEKLSGWNPETELQSTIDSAIDAAKKAAAVTGALASTPETPDQLKQYMLDALQKLQQAPDANNDSALQTALSKIVEQKIANKESASIISTAAEYARIWNTHHEEIKNLADAIAASEGKLPANKNFTLKEFETLRNIASWHGTPLGDAANKALHLIDKPILDHSGITQIDITSGAAAGEPHTLYDAFVEAAHDHKGILHGKSIDAAYLDFIHDHGVPKDVGLKAAKHLTHANEHLWISGDDVVMSQEYELLANVDTDLGPDEDVSNKGTDQAPADTPAKKPDTPAHAAELPPKHDAPPKPAAQAAPAPKPGVDTPAPAPSPEPTPDATQSTQFKGVLFDRGPNFTIAELIKEISPLRSLTEVSPQIIADCHARPEGLAQFLIDPKSTLYPDLKSEIIIAAARDIKNHASNIRELFGAFFANEKPTLKLTIGDSLVTILPRK